MMIEVPATGIQIMNTPRGAVSEELSSGLEALKEACRDFEAIFLQQLFRIMRESGPRSGLLDGGFADDVYREMLDEQLANEMSRSGNFGLSNTIYEQLRDSVVSEAVEENDQTKAEK